MRTLLSSRWTIAGLIIGVLGCGPLLVIIAMDRVGLWPDANPNPIGPGIMFMIAAWPAIICLVIGFFRSRGTRARAAAASASRGALIEPDPTASALLQHPAVRIVVGAGALALAAYGVATLRGGEGRGPAASIVMGGVLTYWAIAGRLPGWFRRRSR